LASNRDEFYQRQGEPPEPRDDGNNPFVAPLDPKKGGTWFGINNAGLLVALTNRLDANPKKDAPSRGLLVRELLSEAADRSDALDRYRSLEPETYNPHQILFIDPNGLNVVHQELEKQHRYDIESGLFYLDNSSGLITDQQTLKKSFPLDFQGIDLNTFPALEEFCSSHDSFLERDSVCLHVEIAGTLSSSLIYLEPAQETFRFRFAQGPPCETTYESVELSKPFRSKLITAWSRS
jgi:hypothetical protein